MVFAREVVGLNLQTFPKLDAVSRCFLNFFQSSFSCCPAVFIPVFNVMPSEYSFDMLNIEPLKTNNNNPSNNPSNVETIDHTVLSSPLKNSVLT